MQQVKLFGLAVVTAIALGVFPVEAALGAIQVLNSRGELVSNLKSSGTSKKEVQFTILKGFAVTKCSEVQGEGEQQGFSLLGVFHLNAKGCTTNLGGTCTGLNDAAGTILVLGTSHLVWDKLSSEGSLSVGGLVLLEHVHYTCEGGFVPKTLVLVLGEILCSVTPINTLATTFTGTCTKGKEKGDPGETTYWTESGEQVQLGENALLASENEGALTMAAEEGSAEGTASEAVEIMG